MLQDVAIAPNNRKEQLGLTLELQLCCLDWTPPPRLLLSSSPPPPPHHHHQPDPTATPCPTTSQHTSWDCSGPGFIGSAQGNPSNRDFCLSESVSLPEGAVQLKACQTFPHRSLLNSTQASGWRPRWQSNSYKS